MEILHSQQPWCAAGGVMRGILTLQGGIYKNFFLGGIAKLANIAGGITERA
jgi:hypothetical protein